MNFDLKAFIENAIKITHDKLKKDNSLKSDYKNKQNQIEVRRTRSRIAYNYIKVNKFKNNITVIDFETTGLSPINDEIIQIGAIKYQDGIIVDTFDRLVKPSGNVSPKIEKLTGITNKMLESALPISDHLEDLYSFIQGETLVAHNADFDMKFLLENFENYQIKHENFEVIDTLILARKLIHDTKNHKLTTLKEYLNIEAQSHNALEDCRVTGDLYYYLKKIEDNKPGNYDGEHYTHYVETIKEMKRNKENKNAIDLLLNLVDAVEAESRFEQTGPAPWYYEQLAILYRKEKDKRSEIKILERYFSFCEIYGGPNGVTHEKLIERYSKLIG
ncbi:3'-5' exonuclease [Atopobacter phocae]|uniref:3'-5' exonuclease n=1 Tax=Atopobacter phocae TaxID=136492 RepID=UPI0004722973|nr:3'-5' exonuclease [Atopobacter phocae]